MFINIKLLKKPIENQYDSGWLLEVLIEYLWPSPIATLMSNFNLFHVNWLMHPRTSNLSITGTGVLKYD